MKLSIPKEIRAVSDALQGAGFEAYLVGGCVRNLLLAREPNDWDITTNATPDEIQKLFPDSFYENDFGTVGVKTGSEDRALAIVEVTPYRIEEKYTDKRHPDAVKFAKKLEDDLKRRDFTVNAFAYDAKTAELVDLFGGQKDLDAKIIRAVGDAGERFNEDALRILRAVRLAANLEFSIESTTRDAIGRHKGLLEFVSKERSRDELTNMIEGGHPVIGFESMRELGILKFVIPELEEGWMVGQNKHHIYTVWEHNMRAMQYAVENKWSFEVRMSALLHDVGKPRSKRGEGPDSTFYGHEIIGAKMTAQILSRLRFPKKFVDKVAKLVRYHLFYYNVDEVTESSVRRLIARVGAEDMGDLIQVRMCDRIGSGVPKAEPYKLRHFQFMVEKLQRDPISAKMVKLKGEDVMRVCAIEPGPRVGAILEILLEDVLDEPAKNTPEALEARAKELCGMSDAELKKLAGAAKEKKVGLEEEAVGEIKKKHWVK
ncbi:MAG: CCA tRNA nucleotidyltransferase [Candidatus Niyogibacteria bacterium]|nr:CCA tRNA nucleotidyltransferase [Candidatus Niyogibacteria bacterium]